MGENKYALMTLVGEPEGERLLGISNHKCENNIKTDIKEVVCDGVEWIHVAQNIGKCLPVARNLQIL
jgi:hypothetical protein